MQNAPNVALPVEHSDNFERGLRPVNNHILIEREKEHRLLREVRSPMSLAGCHGKRLESVVKFGFNSVGCLDAGSLEQVGPNWEDILVRVR